MDTFPYTEDQKKDAIRRRRYIEREQLCSTMNATKWREAIQVLLDIPNFTVRYRAKAVREDAPPPDQWEGFFSHLHLGGSVDIEWLEIDPIQRIHRGALLDDLEIDRTAEVVQALHSVPVPFTLESNAIRIWGYTRPGASPEFVERK